MSGMICWSQGLSESRAFALNTIMFNNMDNMDNMDNMAGMILRNRD